MSRISTAVRSVSGESGLLGESVPSDDKLTEHIQALMHSIEVEEEALHTEHEEGGHHDRDHADRCGAS